MNGRCRHSPPPRPPGGIVTGRPEVAVVTRHPHRHAGGLGFFNSQLHGSEGRQVPQSTVAVDFHRGRRFLHDANLWPRIEFAFEEMGDVAGGQLGTVAEDTAQITCDECLSHDLSMIIVKASFEKSRLHEIVQGLGRHANMAVRDSVHFTLLQPVLMDCQPRLERIRRTSRSKPPAPCWRDRTVPCRSARSTRRCRRCHRSGG